MAEDGPTYERGDDTDTTSDAASKGYITPSVVTGRTSIYRLPEPALIKMPKDQRVPMKSQPICQCCKVTKFGLFTGKQHCRACGQVVCGKCTQRRHPLHKKMLICRHCYSKGMVESFHMQDFGCYHGPLTRHEAEDRLRIDEVLPGDYLVRESGGLDGFLALSVSGENKLVTHYLINVHRDLFYVGTSRTTPNENDELFDSLEAMLDSAEVIRLCKLRRGVIVNPPDDEICPRCKFVNESASTLFCGGCGTRLNSTAAQRKLYYDLGVAMRDPSFNQSSITNPGYQVVGRASEGMVNTSYGQSSGASGAVYDNKAIVPPQELYNNMDDIDNIQEEEASFKELNPKTITVGSQSGQGYFGPVHKGYLAGVGKKAVSVSIKMLNPKATDKERDAFVNEVLKLSKLSHPNVVLSYGAVTVAPPVMSVVEFCSEGSLDELLRANDARLDEKTRLSLLRDYAQGLEYISGMKIVHRDVSARNCLVTLTDDEHLVAKISDMGLSRDLVENYYVASIGTDVARRWAAPEVICFNAFSSLSDVWSFGITLFETFQQHPGSQPFYFVASIAKLGEKYSSEKATQELLVDLLKDLQRTCTGEMRELISKCLSFDKHGRPAFGEIVVKLTDALEGTERWDFPRKNLKLVSSIGAGAFGKVERYVATGLGPTSIDVAVKSCTDIKGEQKFLQEINTMKTLRHPHIVRMLASCLTKGPPLMVLEYCAGGSLDHHLRQAKLSVSPSDLQSILYQVACAMTYLVERQVVHRDLSARNCLVSLPLNIKLADFGLARETEESLYEMSSSTNVPVRWTAPECFRTRTFSEATDVFSFGALAWEVYTYPWDRKKPYKHVVPFNELSDQQFVTKLRTDSLPELVAACPANFMTPLIKETIKMCRSVKSEGRPTFEALVENLAPFKK